MATLNTLMIAQDFFFLCCGLALTALKILLFVFSLLLGVAYLTLLERKVIASMQLRIGPNTTGPFGLLQPIADGIKLLNKETIIPTNANKFLFLGAPVLLFSLSLSVWSVIPFSDTHVFSDLNVGLLYALAISSLAVYGIIIAGWASRSRYAFLGAMRSSAQMISYEVSIGLIMVCIIACANSLNLGDIVRAQEKCWYVIPLFPLWVVFFVSSLAECNRTPFDLPEAEAELVSGYSVEYSAFTYALFYLSEYANMILLSAINVLLFFGGWLAPFKMTFIPPVLWFLIKIFFFLFLFIWIRATMPRYRYDQLMRLGWKVFLPFSLVAVFIVSFVLGNPW